MMPLEMRAKRIELLQRLDVLQKSTGNEKQIRAIGDKLMKLVGKRKRVKIDEPICKEESRWKEKVKTPRKLDLTVDEYIEFVRKGLSDREIIKHKNTTDSTLQRWKIANDINKHELKRRLKMEESKNGTK